MTASHAHLSAARVEAAMAAALLPDAAPLRAAPTGKCPQSPASFLPLPTNLWPSCDATHGQLDPLPGGSLHSHPPSPSRLSPEAVGQEHGERFAPFHNRSLRG